ncbi:MAG: lipid-A-disaccharide synthase [Sedimentisphaerales bacterium]|nr:lipid-A-disaccharide synthase [Sedimentisphaerales bacterium]
MAEPRVRKRIFISACEPSAEQHCARLIRAAEARGFNRYIEWVGLGGDQMQAAGCQILEDTVRRAAMIYNAIGQAGFFWKVLRQTKSYFRHNPVDLVILCDSPAFNFHVAKAAKRYGIPTLFYVAPQLWAWAPWRIGKLRRTCDKLACILPFEEDWFCSRNVDAHFIGNPLFDDVAVDLTRRVKDYSNYEPRKVRIALLPGSRIAEIKSLWPAMQKVAIQLLQKWPQAQFTATAPNEEKLQLLKQRKITGFKCEYTVANVLDIADQSDFALVASGSATLQVAAAGCPMVILYQSSRLLWHLMGRWLIRTRFLSLINILAGRELVTEFMPYFTSIRPIAERCGTLIGNKSLLVKTSTELKELVAPLMQSWASDEVALMAWEMLDHPDRQVQDQTLETELI